MLTSPRIFPSKHASDRESSRCVLIIWLRRAAEEAEARGLHDVVLSPQGAREIADLLDYWG